MVLTVKSAMKSDVLRFDVEVYERSIVECAKGFQGLKCDSAKPGVEVVRV